MKIDQTITRDDDLIAEATVEAACITPEGRARRPPMELVESLRPYLLDPGAS